MRFYINNDADQEIIDLDQYPDDDNENNFIVNPSNLVGLKITKCYKNEVGDIIFEVE